MKGKRHGEYTDMAITSDRPVTETCVKTQPDTMMNATEELDENSYCRKRFGSIRRNGLVMPLLPPFLQSSKNQNNAGNKMADVSADEKSNLQGKQTNQLNGLERQGLLENSVSEKQRLAKEKDESDEWPSSSYQDEEGSTDQVDSDEPKTPVPQKKDPLWFLSPCETDISSGQDDEDENQEQEELEYVDFENTTEPYLAHELLELPGSCLSRIRNEWEIVLTFFSECHRYIPYEEIPKPRFFYPTGRKVPYVPRSLPKRARSPVREMLPGKFDLEAAQKEWCRKMELDSGGEHLKLSKERMSETLRDSMAQNLDLDTIISSIVLQAICEQVSLTIDLDVQSDISGFVNIDTVLALVELDNLDIDMMNDEQRRISWELRNFYPPDDDEFPIPGKIPGYRKILLTAYRSKFSRFFCPMLHRRLPWSYMSAVHQRGQTSCYTNARDRIDEIEPSSTECSMAYVSDVKCSHAQQAHNKSYVAYKRRSKDYSLPQLPVFEGSGNLLLNLVNFM